MSNDEDDYLSDKFLLEPLSSSTSAPKTYSQRRRDVARISALKSERNRQKSRKQLESEAREEGLSKSLFERAKEEEASGQQNKALAMMMKMGYKPGQSLGQREEEDLHSTPQVPTNVPSARSPTSESGTSVVKQEENPADDSVRDEKPSTSKHRTVPLPLNEWAGKQGIGLGKRAASPGVSERLAKMAKMAEEHDHTSFRDRARLEYEERRAEGRLAPAQRTCATLDEKAGKEFNVLWLNPHNPDTFPEGFVDALEDPLVLDTIRRSRADDTIEGRLRAKMQADALHPLKAGLDEDETVPADSILRKTPYSEEDIEEATQFLRLTAKDRLELVLSYLRQKYLYCFWCGTQYTDDEDMGTHCPGPDEDAHD